MDRAGHRPVKGAGPEGREEGGRARLSRALAAQRGRARPGVGGLSAFGKTIEIDAGICAAGPLAMERAGRGEPVVAARAVDEADAGEDTGVEVVGRVALRVRRADDDVVDEGEPGKEVFERRQTAAEAAAEHPV